MNNLRTLINSYFNTSDKPTELDTGQPIPEGAVEDGITYFGYSLEEDYEKSDLDHNFKMNVIISGLLIRRVQAEENTTLKLDTALDYLKKQLKAMNFKYSYHDVSMTDNIKKIFISATCKYNEINGELLR